MAQSILYAAAVLAAAVGTNAQDDGAQYLAARDWRSVTANGPGTKIAVAPNNGPIIVTEDHGEHWVEVSEIGDWAGVTTSSDFTHLCAWEESKRVMLRSTDGGRSWRETAYAPDGDFWRFAVYSRDSTQLWATTQFYHLYYSDDDGASWNRVTSVPHPADYDFIELSKDGTHILTGGSLLYHTSDYGSTWSRASYGTQGDQFHYRKWSDAAVSGTGDKQVAVVYGGALWVSSDGGASWMEHDEVPLLPWAAVAIDDDGSKMIAVADTGEIWHSTNGGDNWEEIPNPAPPVSEWTDISMSDDGEYIALIADNEPGEVWLSTNGGASWKDVSPLRMGTLSPTASPTPEPTDVATNPPTASPTDAILSEERPDDSAISASSPLIIVPILAVVFFVALLYCWMRRKRSRLDQPFLGGLGGIMAPEPSPHAGWNL